MAPLVRPGSESGPTRLLARAMGMAAVTFSLGILAAAAMGSFMRLSGDDYCYGGVVSQHGFLEAQRFSYFEAPPYHGNRFSLTFFAGLATILGPWSSAALPALTLLGLVTGMTWCGWRLARWARAPHPLLLGYCAAVIIVFLTVYQAPDRVQSVYWRSANLPYAAHLPLGWIVLGLVLWQAETAKPSAAVYPAILGVTFVAGGFSEVAAVLQLVWLAAAVAATFLWTPPPYLNRRSLRLGLSAAGVGAILALTALAVSPFASRGLARLETHPSVLFLAGQALRGGFSFLRETLEGLPVPSALTVAAGGFLGAALPGRRSPRTRQALGSGWGVALCLASSVILAGAAMAPSLYANGFLPNPRALIGARHAMVLALFVTGVLAARWLRVGGHPRMVAVAGIGLAIVAVYPLRAAGRILAEAPAYRSWAAAWDARHAAILEARTAGATEVHVLAIPPIVPGVGELASDAGYWYNGCAADYYDLRSIAADLPAADG